MIDSELEALAERLGVALAERGLLIATAESCTGGLVGAAITAIAGSSGWFERGFVTYSNQAKTDLLDVPAEVLRLNGAVSEATAAAMVAGALAHSSAQVALAITGIAGPGGGLPGKPVGTVCFGWQCAGQAPAVQTLCFAGDRAAVRAQAAQHALAGMLQRLPARG